MPWPISLLPMITVIVSSLAIFTKACGRNSNGGLPSAAAAPAPAPSRDCRNFGIT